MAASHQPGILGHGCDVAAEATLLDLGDCGRMRGARGRKEVKRHLLSSESPLRGP